MALAPYPIKNRVKRKNKMEQLQSQAPVDRELSGSSASARHATSDIGHYTSNRGHGTQEFGNIEEKFFRGDTKRQKNYPNIGIISKYSNDLIIVSLVWFGIVWYGTAAAAYL